MTGTAIKRLILQKIKAAVVPVAPLAEQRRIVAEIEKQFSIKLKLKELLNVESVGDLLKLIKAKTEVAPQFRTAR